MKAEATYEVVYEGGSGAPWVSSTAETGLSVQTFEIVVWGEVGPTLVKALTGSNTFHSDHGQTRLVARDEQAALTHLLAALGDSDISLVSLHSVAD